MPTSTKWPRVLTFAVVGLCTCLPTANASLFTAAEKNLEAMTEAGLMTASKMIQVLGRAPGVQTLPFTGTFDDTGWSMHLSGSYLGRLADLSFVGVFDGSTDGGTFASTGTLGGDNWTGFGSWSFSDVTDATIEMSWASHAIFQDKKPDKEFDPKKVWTKTMVGDNWHITDTGKYFDTEDGKRVGAAKDQISDWIEPKDGPVPASIFAALIQDRTVLTGLADFRTGNASGAIQVVPEPAILTLVGLGVLGSMVCRRRKT